ncbi:MAG: hypothetical protein C4520_09755 [Candidatus Abyssobacteria bacterium SURF_5]|uniref:Uncharacterized protein n=1 Tax=Abyssobacteria bacterium (strain SURF_5) TaxID=2093360 RepID=A0A3A4NLM5_ABYX5|nr:MAG: hypothetical protein C4520_09755 [Candidatus Abyssubacteria bacterium SURF_5]
MVPNVTPIRWILQKKEEEGIFRQEVTEETKNGNIFFLRYLCYLLFETFLLRSTHWGKVIFSRQGNLEKPQVFNL